MLKNAIHLGKLQIGTVYPLGLQSGNKKMYRSRNCSQLAVILNYFGNIGAAGGHYSVFYV